MSLRQSFCQSRDGVAGEVYFSKALNLRVRIPKGFKTMHLPTPPPGKHLQSYVATYTAPGKVQEILHLQSLGGLLPDAPLDETAILRGFRNNYGSPVEATLDRWQWKGAEIPVVRSKARHEDVRVEGLTAYVPTSPEAIAVIIVGDPSEGARLIAHLKEILSGLEGRVGWEKTTGKGRKLTWYERGEAFADLLKGFGILLLIVVGFIAWRRGKRKKREQAAPPLLPQQKPPGNDGQA